MKRSDKTIGVIVGDISNIEIHAVAVSGDYDTLCGIDADDPAIGMKGTIDAGLHKIDCLQCRSIIEGVQALKFRSSDFA